MAWLHKNIWDVSAGIRTQMLEPTPERIAHSAMQTDAFNDAYGRT